ncbi:unnamed protein product [Prunus armeniaca]|uniref:Bifunctional inhibitor/plant lipid transfer protein/seed storage helical domain-containing protein n=1 Tax=Prunus armeniaca TaxID=36596 RepID=A0A6J5X4X7_PRUAR|nr:unnamed protein product [Prunus armeniaca]
MAFKLSIFMLCVAALMLVLLQANQASTVETSALQQQENYQPSADRGAPLGARPQHTRSLVCFSAKSVVQSACVCLLEHMETSKFALATTTGRPREEDQNAPN